MENVQMTPVAALVERPSNPKRHTKDQIDRLATSIKAVGFNDPIVVDADGVVVEGHGRIAAAKQLGMEDVPVIRLAELSGPQAEAYAILHNSLTCQTGMDTGRMVEGLEAVGIEPSDAHLAGVSEVEFLMNTEEARARDRQQSPATSDDGIGRALEGSNHSRRMQLRFRSEDARRQFLAVVLRLKNSFPEEDTLVERLLRYIRRDRQRRA